MLNLNFNCFHCFYYWWEELSDFFTSWLSFHYFAPWNEPNRNWRRSRKTKLHVWFTFSAADQMWAEPKLGRHLSPSKPPEPEAPNTHQHAETSTAVGTNTCLRLMVSLCPTFPSGLWAAEHHSRTLTQNPSHNFNLLFGIWSHITSKYTEIYFQLSCLFGDHQTGGFVSR